MADRTCPKCKICFKYPSILKTHMKISFHCITNIEEIDNIILNNKQIKQPKNIIIKCNICDKIFKSNSSLVRHKKNTKCNQININVNTNNNTKSNNISNEDIIHFIKKLSPKLAKNIESLIEKQNRQIINNNQVTNNTINNNNNTINNTTIIHHINPFGF